MQRDQGAPDSLKLTEPLELRLRKSAGRTLPPLESYAQVSSLDQLRVSYAINSSID